MWLAILASHGSFSVSIMHDDRYPFGITLCYCRFRISPNDFKTVSSVEPVGRVQVI